MNPNDPRSNQRVKFPGETRITYRLIGWDNESGRSRGFGEVSNLELALHTMDNQKRATDPKFTYDNYDIVKIVTEVQCHSIVIEPDEYPDRSNSK